MRKLNFALSISIYLAFTIIFTYNYIVQFDLFYVMWGAILLPIPISLIISNNSEKPKQLNLWNVLATIFLIVIVIIHYYYPEVDSFDSMPDPGPRFIDFILYFAFGLTILLSYLILLSNYKVFNKRQILQYILHVPAFLLCLYSFGKYQTLEYVSGGLLFLIISYNYIDFAYKTVKQTLVVE
jgi:uncharacterized membrane protein HdeD (DUF308 family)